MFLKQDSAFLVGLWDILLPLQLFDAGGSRAASDSTSAL